MDNFRLVIIGRARSNYKGNEETAPEISTRPELLLLCALARGRRKIAWEIRNGRLRIRCMPSPVIEVRGEAQKMN
jgi:hypothetical protein